MRRTSVPGIRTVLVLLAASMALAQEPDFESILRFEGTGGGETLHGWGGGPAETIHLDRLVVRTGSGAARLERDAESASAFSTITKLLPIDFSGEWLELRGFLRTENVSDFAGLWMREDGPSGPLQFDNMQNRAVQGTTDWTGYAIRLPLDPKARQLLFGVLVVGEGKVWADDLELLVDDEPIDRAPRRAIPTTVLDTDRAFDAGSGITLSSLTESQVENVAVLGTVWGFLKYHHPRVAKGGLHWDYELFRVLPRVLDAEDPADRNRTLSKWLDEIGVPERCEPCAQAPMRPPHLLPPIEWIKDGVSLGETLSRQLQNLHTNRFAGDEPFYVSQVPGVGNPIFDRELPYPSQKPPDSGYRILSLLRLWNIIEYWFPYRDQIDGDWHAVLRQVLPRFVAADDWDLYRLELLALIARMGDTHANLWSELDVRPPRGRCFWPVGLRFIEGRATVIDFTGEGQGTTSLLEIGDVIESIDGQPIGSLIEAWSPYYSASNHTTRLSHIAHFLPRGECGTSRLGIARSGASRTVNVPRLEVPQPKPTPHDRPGETFQLLSPEVAYLKVSSIRAQDVVEYLERAADTRGLVIDIRGYPSEFVVFDLGSRLVTEPTPFARFTVGDLDNPGAFTWTESLILEPRAPAYGGKIAILVDEAAISSAEYTAMAFRAGPNAVVVGSTTAGADGNVSSIPLPGGLRTMISGIGVFYPDKTPTQRVGIVPDIVALPTIDGVREGRDEILERALRHLLGPEADEATIRRLARRR
ncbi:MAG TPA: S41 family peptidase [Vicinamibacteria bacterium]|nr:S41 family peptidase [Vicinamibacteria bacterium]